MSEDTKKGRLADITSGGLMNKIDKGQQVLGGKSITADDNFEEKFDKYRRTQKKKLTERTKEDLAEQKEGLDYLLDKGQAFQGIVSKLNVDLAQYFDQYGVELEQVSEYVGMEKAANSKILGAIFGKKRLEAWANQKLYDRLRDQPLDQNTKQMLIHGKNIVEICKREIESMETAYSEVTTDLKNMTDDYRAALAGKREYGDMVKDKQAELDSVEAELKVADPDVRGGLEAKANDLRQELDDANTKLGQYKTVVMKCEEQKPILDSHLESYVGIIKSVREMRQNIQQDVMHYANILPNVQKLYQTVVSVKGAEQYGEQMRTVVAGATKFAAKANLEIAKVNKKMQEDKPLSDEEFEAVMEDLTQGAQTMEEMYKIMDDKHEDLYAQ